MPCPGTRSSRTTRFTSVPMLDQQSNGKRWAGWLFFDIPWLDVCVANLLTQEKLYLKIQVMQCDAFSPTVHADVTLTFSTIVADQVYSLVHYSLMVSFSSIMTPATKQQWFRNTTVPVQGVDFPSKFHRSQSNPILWDLLSKQVQDQLPTCWCQIPQQTTRGLEQSMSTQDLHNIRSKFDTITINISFTLIYLGQTNYTCLPFIWKSVS